MSFEWKTLLTLADHLRSEADSEPDDTDLAEAKWRTSVSRAYYAVFHRARDHYGQYWADSILDKKRGTPHKDVIDAYAAKQPYVGNPAAKHAVGQVVDHLDRLRRMRQAADYRSFVNDPRRLASNAVHRAQIVEDALTKLVR